MPTPAEELSARLTRIKTLIEQLEQVCSESDEQRDAFVRLHAELEAARRALKPLK